MSSIFFDLRFRNYTQSTFDKIAKDSHVAFDNVRRDVAATERQLSELGSKGGGIGIAGVAMGSALGAGIAKGIGTAKDFIASSLTAAMDFGMQQKSFEVLTGDSRIGRDLTGQLRQLKQETIMGASVYKNAQTLMGFGIGQGEVVKDLRMIGDIAMGDVDRMQSLTLAFAQTRSAGRLMGQDLLQYINAGFNPLKVMADHWKDFGFKTAQTVGSLKDKMGEGAISADMVTKAFIAATSKGGMFYNMMDKIGETTGGKMMKLQGNMAAFKIDVGNALMPIANSFMEAGNSALHWMNISKTVPETLMAEKMEINSLVDGIVHLNKGNQMRAAMIDNLVGKYPSYFVGIDTEKVKNLELLDVLKKVNAEYDRKVAVAAHQLTATKVKENISDLTGLAVRAKAEADYERMNGGKKLGVLSGWDRVRMTFTGLTDPMIDNDADYLAAFAKKVFQSQMPQMYADKNRADFLVKQDSILQLVDDAKKLWGNPAAQKELWGKGADKMLPKLVDEMAHWNKALAASHGKISGEVLAYDYSNMERLVHYSKAQGTGATEALSEVSDSVIKGGQKVINIHVHRSLIENQTFKVGSMAEALSVSMAEQEGVLVKMLEGAANSVS